MSDYTEFQRVQEEIMRLGDIPDATTHEEWILAYKKLREVQGAFSKMINGDHDYDIIKTSSIG